MAATNPFRVSDLIKKYGWMVMPYLSNLGVNLLCESQVLFVDSGATDTLDADDTEHGHSFEKPLATLDYAIGLTTASEGAIILLAPGHAESKTTTGNIALLDVAGVTVIGLGSGSLIPTFTLGHAGTTLSVTAANCKIKNIKLISDIADCAAGITAGATADGLEVEDCILTDGAAAKELVIGISLAAACDGVKIINNQFYTVDTGGCASAIKMVGACDRSIISGNIIFGDYSVACIDGSTAAQAIVIIRDNVMRNVDTTAGTVIKLHSSSMGIITKNLMQGGHSIAGCVTAAAAMVVENYASGAAGAQGILEPVIDAD